MSPLLAAVIVAVAGMAATAYATLSAEGTRDRAKVGLGGSALTAAVALAVLLAAPGGDVTVLDPVQAAFNELEAAAELPHDQRAGALLAAGFMVHDDGGRLLAATFPDPTGTLCVLGLLEADRTLSGAVVPDRRDGCNALLAARELPFPQRRAAA